MSNQSARAASVAFGFVLVLTIAARADLVAHYPFNESLGTNAPDVVGGVNGTLQGTSSFVAGGIVGSNAVSLTRSGDGVVNMGNNFGFPTGDFSISFWVNTTTTEADTLALSKHSAGFVNSYLFPINTTGGGGAADKANFTVATTISGGVTSTTSVNDGAWHHIVGVYQSGGNLSIYVDGAPAEQTKVSSPMITSASSFYVGGVGDISNALVADGRYTGLIDDLQIYNNALSDSNVGFLFSNPGQVVPEPASAALFTAVLLAGFTTRRRRAA